MEAFVDPSYQDGVIYVPPLPLNKRPDGRRGNSSYQSSAATSPGYVRDETGRDPFKGF